MNVAFIPVRGGSKSIPLKNIKEMAGKPLVCWSILAACGCEKIARVYVATDSKEIRDVVLNFCGKERFYGKEKVQVVERSSDTASDTASTESAMLEFAAKFVFDNIVLIQATSPLLTTVDLNKGFEKYESAGVDSVLSVVKQKRFVWMMGENKLAVPVNYDCYKRPRRQEFQGYYVENGAFYITSKERLLCSENRISGNIAICEMPEKTYVEIDEPSDWNLVETLLYEQIRDQAVSSRVKLFLTDVDGCLTDGGMYYSENGDVLKKFQAQDGMGLSLLKKTGVVVAVVTGEEHEINRKRCQKLGIDEYYPGVQDKFQVVQSLCEKYGCTWDNVACIGDDINDLEVLKKAGMSFAPANAVDEVKNEVQVVTKHAGGQGAIREACDVILRRNNYGENR